MGAIGWWLVLASAWGAEPVIAKSADGAIEGWVDVSAPPAEVYAVNSDPRAMARIDGSAQVKTEADGDCWSVHTHIDHPIASTDYQSRSCADGELAVKQTLTESRTMKYYEARFQVDERPEGSRLHYRIHVQTTLPVPQFVVDRATHKGMGRLLQRLRDHFESRS